MIKQKWVACLVAFAAFGVSLPALADAPATSNVIQIGLGFRYGFELEEGDFNPWGPGLGIAAGYTLPVMPIYVGGNFDYFFGDTLESPLGELSGNIWQLMGEGGYDIGIGGGLVLRPKLGLGIAGLSQEVCITNVGMGETCGDDSEVEFAAAPGVTFVYLGPISLTLDLRYDMIFAEETGNALIVSAGIGF